MKQKSFLFLITLFLMTQTVFAEYRAFLIEIWDHVSKNHWETTTGFSPDKYILTHGGGNRLSTLVKATWVCYGDTSKKKPCPMPEAKNPIFKKGDSVKVTLKKHLSEDWIGKVELSLYRQDLKSNVYGLRFKDHRKSYGRFYEFNLIKASPQNESSPNKALKNKVNKP